MSTQLLQRVYFAIICLVAYQMMDIDASSIAISAISRDGSTISQVMFETIKRSFMSPFSSVLIVARAIYMGTPLTTAEHFIVGLWWRLVVRAAVPLLSFVLMTPVVSNGTVQPPFWLVFLALFYQTPQFTLLVIFTYLWWVAGKSSRGVGNRLGGRRQ